MVYLIIGVALLFIIAPIVAVLPSKRQKAQMAMRNVARDAGVIVELTTMTDPNPKQDKYISHIGKPIPPELKVASYRLQRRREDNWRSLPRIDWCLQRGLDKSWRWAGDPDEQMNASLVSWLTRKVESLPLDVEQVEEVNYNLAVYWHEREAGSELQVLDFLKECAEMPLREPRPEPDEADEPAS